MIRIASLILVSLFGLSKALCFDKVMVNDIEFIVDTGCPYVGYTVELSMTYSSYQWEDANDSSIDLDTDDNIYVTNSSTYCVTVTNDQGVSCSACVDLEILEVPNLLILDATVCSEDIGVGPTSLDFNSQIVEGALNGIWTDDSSTGVDLSDVTNVDFTGLPFGSYLFSYTVDIGNCGLDATSVMTVEVVDCGCPILQLNDFGEHCNEGSLFLGIGTANFDGEWSSEDLNISNDTLILEGEIPGNYELLFTWFEFEDVCPHEFYTTIDIIGCFQVEEVLSVETGEGQVIFSWTEDLQALDLEIVVLEGPEGMRDDNTYTISGLSPSEQVGIEIFINSEGYQYDNDLVAFGETWTVGTEDSQSLSDVMIYPNPCRHFISIDGLRSLNDIKASFISMDGRCMDKEILISNDQKVDISKLKSGLHILRLQATGGVKYLSFVKVDE